MAEAAAHQPADVRKRRKWRMDVSSALLFGLVGMATGILGAVLAVRADRQQAAVEFSAFPSASATDLTQAGLGVRVQLINQSLRPVIVRSVSLWQGSQRVADGTGYLADTRVLDSAGADPTAVAGRRLNLPLDLAAREGRTIAFLLDVWAPLSAARAPDGEAAARNRLNGLLRSLSIASPASQPLRLEVQLAPGGLRRYSLAGEVAGPAVALASAAAAPDWIVTPVARGARVLGLQVRRTGAGARQVGVVRLDVWGQRTSVHRVVFRPVAGTEATLFPLGSLPRGGYMASFRVAGEVVAEQTFVMPWPKERCAHALFDAKPAAVWC